MGSQGEKNMDTTLFDFRFQPFAGLDEFRAQVDLGQHSANFFVRVVLSRHRHKKSIDAMRRNVTRAKKRERRTLDATEETGQGSTAETDKTQHATSVSTRHDTQRKN